MPSEVTTHAHIDRDRIKIETRRVYNVGKYESIEFIVGLSSDRQTSETIKQAFNRIETEVMDEFNKLRSKVENKHSVGSKGGV